MSNILTILSNYVYLTKSRFCLSIDFLGYPQFIHRLHLTQNKNRRIIIISIINPASNLFPFGKNAKSGTIKKMKSHKSSQSFALMPEWKRKQIVTKQRNNQGNAFVAGMFILLLVLVLSAF